VRLGVPFEKVNQTEKKRHTKVPLKLKKGVDFPLPGPSDRRMITMLSYGGKTWKEEYLYVKRGGVG